MGILNITPDSFSRDGLAFEGASRDEIVRAAVAQARRMVEDGAEMLDIGGESTRPTTENETPLAAAIERERVVPVIAALAAELPASVILSIDTYKASVAAAALDAGAHLVNDIMGLHHDPEMAGLVAARGVPVVLMSNLRGQPRHDPLGDVLRQLSASLQLALTPVYLGANSARPWLRLRHSRRREPARAGTAGVRARAGASAAGRHVA